jgi:hypothetical protein
MTDINRGPYHAMIDRMARARQAITGESFAKAFTECYTDPKNAAIRDGARLDHLAKAHDAMYSTKLSLIPAAKAAPADALQDYVSPSSGSDELDRLIITRMKSNPKLSYQQAFTTEYLLPKNRSLKDRVDSQSILRMQGLESAKPFPAYTAPGHR